MNSEGIATPLTASVRGVIAACAASAGAHAALVPRHLEQDPRLGVAFIAATLVLLAVATKAVEAVGLVFSIQLNTTRGGRCSLIQEEART